MNALQAAEWQKWVALQSDGIEEISFKLWCELRAPASTQHTLVVCEKLNSTANSESKISDYGISFIDSL